MKSWILSLYELWSMSPLKYILYEAHKRSTRITICRSRLLYESFDLFSLGLES